LNSGYYKWSRSTLKVTINGNKIEYNVVKIKEKELSFLKKNWIELKNILGI